MVASLADDAIVFVSTCDSSLVNESQRTADVAEIVEIVDDAVARTFLAAMKYCDDGEVNYESLYCSDLVDLAISICFGYNLFDAEELAEVMLANLLILLACGRSQSTAVDFPSE